MNYSENMGLSYNRITQKKIKDAKIPVIIAKQTLDEFSNRHQVDFEAKASPHFEVLLKQSAELSILHKEKRAHLVSIKKAYKLALFELKDDLKLNRSEVIQERKLTIRKVMVNYHRALKPYQEQGKANTSDASEKLRLFNLEFKTHYDEFVSKLDEETKEKLAKLKNEFELKIINLKDNLNKQSLEIKDAYSKENLKLIKIEKKKLILEAKKEIASLKSIKKEAELKDLEEVKRLKFTLNDKKKQVLETIKLIKQDSQIYYQALSKDQKRIYQAEEKYVRQDQLVEFKNSVDRFERKIFKKINPAYIYITPAVFSALFFTILPFVFMLIASMFKVNLTALEKSTFQGFNNFIAIFTRDVEFQKSLSNTLIYALTTVGLLTVVTIGMAAWLSKNTKINNAVQTMIFTPHIASLVAISILWIALLHPTGLINQLLSYFGIEGPGWLIQENTSLFSISLVAVWKDIGYYVLIIIAGLQAIPSYVYEAAKLDKASKMKTFFSITVPLLTPTLSFVFVNNFINSFKVFATIEIMTNGGPLGSSMVLSYWIYKVGRIGYNYGFAMAGAIILTALIAAFTWVNWKFLNKKITY